MYIRIVTFGLDGIAAEQYEAQAEAIAEQFTHWRGLQSKLWLADHATNTFGGVYLFDSKAHADETRRSPLFRALTNNSHFTDLTIREYDTLRSPTRTTAAGVVPTA